MKYSLASSAAIAVLLHLALFAVLYFNADFTPEPPKEKEKPLIHATMVDYESLPAQKEARRKAALEAKRKAEEEARRKAEAEARKKAEAEAKKRAEAEAKKKAEAEARRKAEEEARRQAEAEARRKAEEQARIEAAQKAAQEEARKQAELALRKAEEAKKKAEEEAKKKAEAEAKKKAEEEAKKKAEAEAKRKAEEEARRKAREKSLEDDILGSLDGPGNGQGTPGNNAQLEMAQRYGLTVKSIIEDSWHVEKAMNGKTVNLTVKISENGSISGQTCTGDSRVCQTVIQALERIHSFPPPPKECSDCRVIHFKMTPKI
ncbi:cell envelope integrity protein TolA [Succinimonas sp.]|uniref:cell envelope integrity protein TolA n=1 Tax=Succinimonas sp. TaxID=1936151 RepID=UPI00386AB5E9